MTGKKKGKTGGSLKAGLIFAGFGAFVYLVNRLCPKLADDYAFSFIWDGKSNGNLAYGNHRYKRVRTGKDLVKSQISHYKTWSGRIIAESLNQMVLMKDDKVLYDRINTGVILMQLMLCLLLGRGRLSLKKISPGIALLLCGGYWFSTPHLAATSIWTTGATNYSWMGLLQSAFLLPYGLEYHDERFSVPKAVSFLSGLLAGWSNEAGGGIAVLMSAAACIRAKKLSRDRGWMLAGLCGVIAGYALLMLAPGNFRRIKIEKEYSDILSEEISGSSMVSEEYQYTPAMFKHYLKNSFSSVALRQLPLELPVILYFLQKGDRVREDSAYILALEAAAFSVPCLLMLSPQFPKRAAYPSIIYRLSSAVKAMEGLELSSFSCPDGWRAPLFFVGIAAGAELILNAAATLFVNADLYIQTEEQIRLIQEGREGEIVNIPSVMISPFWTRFAKDRGIDNDTYKIIGFDTYEGDPYNTGAAAYYGAEGIRAYIPKDHPYLKRDMRSKKIQILRPVQSFLKRLRSMLPGKINKYARKRIRGERENCLG